MAASNPRVSHYRRQCAQYSPPANEHFIRQKGSIRSYSRQTHCGFISSGGRDVYFSDSCMLRSEHKNKLKVGLAVSFELTSGPRGCKTLDITIEDEPVRYYVPQEVKVFYDSMRGYTKVEAPKNYLIRAGDRDPLRAFKKLSDKAEKLGANALVGLFHHTKLTYGSSGRGGTFYFHRHYFTAQPCIVAKKARYGKYIYKEIPKDLNKTIEEQLNGQEMRSELNVILLCAELLILLLSGLYAWFWPVPGFNIPGSCETKPFWLPMLCLLPACVQGYICRMRSGAARIIEGDMEALMEVVKDPAYRRQCWTRYRSNYRPNYRSNYYSDYHPHYPRRGY